MNPLTRLSHLTTSKYLHWTAWVLRALLVLVFLFWGLIAVAWGILHGVVLPRVETYRPQIEQLASQALGVPVRIGQIKSQSTGLVPALELRDVTLLDAQKREVLRLPRVLASVTPKSLWNFGFEQLYIDGPELDIRRSEDGTIYVAGLNVSHRQESDHHLVDWFFSQTQIVIRGGTLHWMDDQRQLPTLTLTQVDWVMHNSGRRHAMRLDATPPDAWGQRLSLRGIFKQPFWSKPGAEQWRGWNGQLYAQSQRLDVMQVRPYLDLNHTHMDITSGHGALRVWLDVHQGKPTGVQADIALQNVDVQLGPSLQPLALQTASGRFGGLHLEHGFEFHTQDLRFETRDGMRWPGGNVSLTYTDAQANTPVAGSLKADRLDLAAVALIAQRLPLNAQTHAAISSWAPAGFVETLQAQWTGDLASPPVFSAKGRIQQLQLASQVAELPVVASSSTYAIHPGRPGIQGGYVDFEMTQMGGHAHLGVKNGSIDLPGIFEDPRIAFDRLTANVQWKSVGRKLQVQLGQVEFSNADAQGQLQANWHTDDDAQPHQARLGQDVRFPGVLDLQGSLSRADGTKVHRYLPLLLNPETRHYVRDAVLKGTSSDVKFKLKGNLWDMPFLDPKQGEFKLTAKVREGVLAYVPKSHQKSGILPWPVLEQLNGELAIDRISLYVNGATAQVLGSPKLKLDKVYAHIPKMDHLAPELQVRGQVDALAQDVLGVINGSPLGALTHQVLAKTLADGQLQANLQLVIPLNTPDKTQVQGTLTLPGNRVLLEPDAPEMTQLKGQLVMTPGGFSIRSASAHMLGGDVRFEGGNATDGVLQVQARGHFTAEGLRQAKNLAWMARLARYASGSAAYVAQVSLRQGFREMSVSSNLQGLALNLPVPLNKSAAANLPLRFETALLRDSLAPGQQARDQMNINLGHVLAVSYVRDLSGAQPRVMRGGIAVGLVSGELVPMLDGNVAAHISLPRIDLDAWQDLFGGSDDGAGGQRTGRLTATSPELGYLPSRIAIRAQELIIDEHTLNNVVVGGARDGLLWRANIDATQLSGYVELRQPGSVRGSGRVFARLSRLNLAANAASDVAAILDEQPTNIPALDIVVDDFELRGKKLGRLEVDAVNRSTTSTARDAVREWRLNKLNVVMPEATFSASGNWTTLNAQSGPVALSRQRQVDRRRTVMNFKLDIADAGELLKRLGMNDLVRRGKGKIEGQVAWIGSPLALDYPSLGGQLNVQVTEGQFLKADPGIAKLLGVLSLQSLPRRLVLDFRDVFSEGFAFDFLRGDVTIVQGQAVTRNLQMKGVNAAVLMDGTADIAKETQDIRVIVIPEINAGTASLVTSILNPVAGLSSFLAQMVLRRPLIAAATQEFHIDGPWADPKIVKVNSKPPAQANPDEGANR